MADDRFKSATLGVDLGGTHVRTALVDVNGGILTAHECKVSLGKGSEGIVADVVASVERCIDHGAPEVPALGIGVAGQVSFEGVVRHAPNLRQRDIPLRDELEAKLEMPVLVMNDVRAAALGEWRYGSGRNASNFIVLFVGTGVGGCIIRDGRMVSGCTNTCGEFGHMTVASEGRRCHCRNSGCLEAYVGGWAIAERAKEAIRADPMLGQSLLSTVDQIGDLTAAEVCQAYRKGDRLALRLVEETGMYLGAAAVSLVNALNPCLFILGGGVIEGLPELIQIAEGIVRKEALEAAIVSLEFKKATLGKNAGVIGAAASARELLHGCS